MSIAEYIDHTNLKPTATAADIVKLCDEARYYGFRGICINPYWVSFVEKELKDIAIVTVIGFPLGANCVETKMFEAEIAVGDGATEIDIVWNLGAFKSRKYLQVLGEIEKIIDVAKVPIKVIVETCYLDESELIKAHQIVRDSGADYIKTSTGFGTQGANFNDIKVWFGLGNLKIKASGGIKTHIVAKEFIKIGADVLGTSSGVSIIQGEEYKGHLYDEMDSEGLSGGKSIFEKEK